MRASRLAAAALVVTGVFAARYLATPRSRGERPRALAHLGAIKHAFETYRLQHGSYPESLRRLVDAGLLPAKIADEHRMSSGKPTIVYRAETFATWQTGGPWGDPGEKAAVRIPAARAAWFVGEERIEIVGDELFTRWLDAARGSLVEGVAAWYRRHAFVCSRIEYADMASVEASNASVDAMYTIVERAERHGPEAVAKLVALLDDPLARPWLAHQLVEKTTISPEVRRRCIAIVEERAKGDGLEATGEREWLEKWRDGGGGEQAQ